MPRVSRAPPQVLNPCTGNVNTLYTHIHFNLSSFVPLLVFMVMSTTIGLWSFDDDGLFDWNLIDFYIQSAMSIIFWGYFPTFGEIGCLLVSGRCWIYFLFKVAIQVCLFFKVWYFFFDRLCVRVFVLVQKYRLTLVLRQNCGQAWLNHSRIKWQLTNSLALSSYLPSSTKRSQTKIYRFLFSENHFWFFYACALHEFH